MVASRNTVFDFIRRTEQNLETIESGAATGRAKHYEVTQLINSAVGLLFFPKEDIFDTIPQTPLSEIRNVNLPTILHGKLPDDNLRELIRYIRNGFAHYNVYFDNCNNIINGIYIWNITRRKVVDWVAYTSVEDLKSLMLTAAKEFKKITERKEDDDALSRLEKRLGKRIRLISRTARSNSRP
jgi:hypothetical protein